MERKYVPQVWDIITIILLFQVTGFVSLTLYLFIQSSSLSSIIKIGFLQLLLIAITLFLRAIIRSQKIILNEHCINHFYRGNSFFKLEKQSVKWKDIAKVSGEFGIFHIGDKITIYLREENPSISDVVQGKNRILISNIFKGFENLVIEVVGRASRASVDENVNEFIERYRSV